MRFVGGSGVDPVRDRPQLPGNCGLLVALSSMTYCRSGSSLLCRVFFLAISATSIALARAASPVARMMMKRMLESCKRRTERKNFNICFIRESIETASDSRSKGTHISTHTYRSCHPKRQRPRSDSANDIGAEFSHMRTLRFLPPVEPALPHLQSHQP